MTTVTETPTMMGDEGGNDDSSTRRPLTPYDYHRLDSLRSQEDNATMPGLPSPTMDTHHNGNVPGVTKHTHQQDEHVSSEPVNSPLTLVESPGLNKADGAPSPSLRSTKSAGTPLGSPRSIKTAFVPSTPPRSSGSAATVLPTSHSHHSIADSDPKRDSAIDQNTPSSDSQCVPSACQSPASNLHAVSESPRVPSVVVQDDDASRPPKTSRSTRAFLRKFSREADRNNDDAAMANHQRLRSFHGIQMDLSSDSGLEDLNQPEKLKFSNRGSVLLNGKKLDAMFAAATASATADENPDDTNVSDSQMSDTTQSHSHLQSPQPSSPSQPQPSNMPVKGSGLRTGRRTPSVHMLQAVMHGTRVLSAEEVTFSQRVRTMYDHGDEKAAEWTVPGATIIDYPPSSTTPEPVFPRDETPEPHASEMFVDNPRRRPPPENRIASPNTESRLSFIAREPHETAGGVEDWDEVPAGAVDRYGFIQPTRIFSNESTGNSSFSQPDRVGMQRVTTSLQLLSNTPRQSRSRIFRGTVSSKRYSRSLPPSRAPSRHTVRTADHASSIYSYQSNHSTSRVVNPFRSRDRRALDDASDMLTLPPHLANISEIDTPSSAPAYPDNLKRREWAREEKWRKMAHLSPTTKKGGGMKFDFDVTDPKLIARTWKGIPDRWRATAWHAFLSSSARKRGNYPSDETLIRMFTEYQEQSSADDVQIDVDVPRTINLHIMFRRRYRGGQRLLFRVLHAISLHFPTTGYVQGMAALAATFLCYFDEEMAFVMLVRMWQLRGLEHLYRSGFDGLMAALDEFKTNWLRNDSEISEKLVDLGVDPTSYGTRWYLTLFNMSIPFPAQLRIWDVFMLLGDAPSSGTAFSSTNPANGTGAIQGHFGGADLSVLHAASSALIEAMRVVLLDSDFENGMKTLTSWIPVQDEDLLMRVAKAEWKIGMRNRKRDGRLMF